METILTIEKLSELPNEIVIDIPTFHINIVEESNKQSIITDPVWAKNNNKNLFKYLEESVQVHGRKFYIQYKDDSDYFYLDSSTTRDDIDRNGVTPKFVVILKGMKIFKI